MKGKHIRLGLGAAGAIPILGFGTAIYRMVLVASGYSVPHPPALLAPWTSLPAPAVMYLAVPLFIGVTYAVVWTFTLREPTPLRYAIVGGYLAFAVWILWYELAVLTALERIARCPGCSGPAL